jgi:hypothetical protein
MIIATRHSLPVGRRRAQASPVLANLVKDLKKIA